MAANLVLFKALVQNHPTAFRKSMRVIVKDLFKVKGMILNKEDATWLVDKAEEIIKSK